MLLNQLWNSDELCSKQTLHPPRIRIRTLLLMHLIHRLPMTIPLLTVGEVQPRILIVNRGLLPQKQVKEGEKFLDQFRGLRVGEWTETGLHRHILVVDEIGLITTVVVRTVNESESKIETGILPRVGRLCLRLLVGRDRWTGGQIATAA